MTFRGGGVSRGTDGEQPANNTKTRTATEHTALVMPDLLMDVVKSVGIISFCFRLFLIVKICHTIEDNDSTPSKIPMPFSTRSKIGYWNIIALFFRSKTVFWNVLALEIVFPVLCQSPGLRQVHYPMQFGNDWEIPAGTCISCVFFAETTLA